MKKAGVMSPWDLMNQNNKDQNNTVNGNNPGQNDGQKLAEMGAAGNMMGIVNHGKQQQAAQNGGVTQPAPAPMGGTTPAGGVTQPAAAPMGGTTPAGGVTQPAAAPTGGTVNGIQESKPQGAGGATQSPLSANTGAAKTADIGAGLETAAPAAPSAAGTGSDGPRQSQDSSDAGVGSSAVQETDDEISVTLESPTYSDSGSSSSSSSIGSVGSVGSSGGFSGMDGISGGSGMTGGDLLPGKVTGASALFGSVSKFLNGD